MVTLDLIIPTEVEVGEINEITMAQSSQGNMLIPIVVCLAIVAIAIVIVSKVVISKGLKSAK